jgi:hypothetical protein
MTKMKSMHKWKSGGGGVSRNDASMKKVKVVQLTQPVFS